MTMKVSIQEIIAGLLPILIACGAAIVASAAAANVAGRVMYPIDDPYIHLAMARHWAESGIWGVSQAGFSASSSSPGWTLLLGLCFWILGPQEWLPLALNLAAGVAVVALLFRYARESGWGRWNASLGVSAFAIALPLPALIGLGMEHSLHVLLIISLAWRAASMIENGETRGEGTLYALAVLATAFRYESLFIILPLAAFFILQKRARVALGLAVFALLPIALMGGIQIFMGWGFMPASIERKSILGQPGWMVLPQIFERLFGQLYNTGHLMIPYLGCLAMLWRGGQNASAGWSRASVLSAVYLFAAVAHCATASIGWFYRYEAYLLAVAFLALAPAAPALWSAFKHAWAGGAPIQRLALRAGFALAALGLAVPFTWNASSIDLIAGGGANIYQQQYQMGLFVREYYQGEAVVLNDIGAVNFLADIRCLDGLGLGSREPRMAEKRGMLDRAFYARWAEQEDAAIAIVYDAWWPGMIPPNWIKMGEWMVDRKITVADPIVAFYAIGPAQAEPLLNNLEAFAPRLPEGVSVNLAERDE